MSIKISKKIKGYAVVAPEQDIATQSAVAIQPELKTAEVIQMHESLQRPDTLMGCTYKIKSPLFEHALYVTMNDIVLNADTVHEQRRPFEIFVNSKNMDHFQWIVALTRIMSAVFRKGGDVTFLVEELKAVFDPRGGYFKAGGVYMPSIVAELGGIIEQHMKMIGLLHDPDMDPAQRQILVDKRTQYENRAAGKSPDGTTADAAGNGFPAGATQCQKCNTQAVIVMDGCATCLNCGYSKCG